MNLKAGLNWLPITHFDGVFPRQAGTANALVEAGVLVCIPPGAPIPTNVLGSGRDLIEAGEHDLLTARDPAGLRFTATLMPEGSEIQKKLRHKATQIEESKITLT